jgi:hypothetical protein
MRIEVTERLLWDVPDDSDPATIAATYRRVYARKIGEPLRVLGDEWTLLAVDDVTVRKVVGP